MLLKFIKMNSRRLRRSYLLLFLTIVFAVTALVIAMLLVKSQKMAEADRILQDYGNYDAAFCEVTGKVEKKLKEDSRISELGYIYDLGSAFFEKSQSQVTLGAIRDKKAEKMYYVNPIVGRYPEKEGEICIDRITLRSNGFEERIGQKLTLSCMDKQKKKLVKREYILVGIIEVQKQDEGVTYQTRKYPEKMFSVNNATELNFPFAYLSMEEAEKNYLYSAKHILVNISKEEDSDKVISSYLDDAEIKDELIVSLDRVFGREWTALCIMGNQLEYSAGTAGVKESIESGDVQVDAYTKYFIPFFMLLIGIVSSLGIYDSVQMTTEERKGNYGILFGMGMTRQRILGYIILEAVMFFIAGTLAGWAAGRFLYQGVLFATDWLLGISVPSALLLDEYYAVYINMVTKNPYVWSTAILFFVICIGMSGAVKDLFHMTPLGLMESGIHKRKRKNHRKGLYSILNHYVGREAALNHAILYLTVGVVMAVAVFGFLFFHAKAEADTAGMTQRIEEARINGMDYYMKQTSSVCLGFSQYMHSSGVTEKMFQEIYKNDLVKEAKGVIINQQTVLIYPQKEMVSNVLQPQSEYTDLRDSSVMAQLDEKANKKYFEYLGIQTKKQDVFNVPVTGVQKADIARFGKYVVAGELHPEKLESGEEVVVVVPDESFCEYFMPGNSLPLYDFVRPEDFDSSLEVLQGQLPEKYKEYKPQYTVSVDGITRSYWCYDALKRLNTKIGAVICIDVEEESFYFGNDTGQETVKLLAGTDAFKKWGLPNKNYTGVGVTLKDYHDSAKFEEGWMKIMQKAGYMESIDVYSILEEKQRTQRQVMAMFYAVIFVLTAISLICIGNSIAIRIRHMAAEQKILNLLGMTKGRLLFLYIRRYVVIGIVGGIFSIIPVSVYSFFVRYALKLSETAYQNNTTEILSLKKPWVYELPKYDMLNALLFIVAFAVCILSILFITLLVVIQHKKLDAVIEKNAVDEE